MKKMKNQFEKITKLLFPFSSFHFLIPTEEKLASSFLYANSTEKILGSIFFFTTTFTKNSIKDSAKRLSSFS